MNIFEKRTGFYSNQESLEHQYPLKLKVISQFLNILKRHQSWNDSPSIIDKWGEQIQGAFYEQNGKGNLSFYMGEIQGLPQQYLTFPQLLTEESFKFQWEVVPREPHQIEQSTLSIIKRFRTIFDELNSRPLSCLSGNVFIYEKISQEKLKQINWATGSTKISEEYFVEDPPFRSFVNFYRFRTDNKLNLDIPIFKDQNIENLDPINIDSSVFCMAHNDLQQTFSSYNLNFIRYLSDQFFIIGPLMMACSAGSVIYDYKLADIDNHSFIVEQMFDDRRPDEKDPQSQTYIPYSKFGPNCMYMSEDPRNRSEFQDRPLNVDPAIEEFIKDKAKQIGVDIDAKLVKHLAFLLKRDIELIPTNYADVKEEDTDFFEFFNKTVMPFIRLRNPIGGQGGWRFEIRTKTAQFNSDLTAVFVLFDYFMVRLLEARKDLNFYLPISLVHENYHRSVGNNAVRTQKFFFRTNIFDQGEPIVQELTIQQIMFGTNNFVGLFKIMNDNLSKTPCYQKSPKVFQRMETFFRDLTAGKRLTVAQWMRKFIDKHPLYCHDSNIPHKISEDLIKQMIKISKGEVSDPQISTIFD